ncbi:MAG: Protein of uncharacterized function [Pseudomonas sp.]|nr:Protein of uncharacterized function [Pseudomonas sp.]
MSIDSSFANEEDFDTLLPPNTDAQKSPEALEREINARRASIGSLVDALENKLSPGQLVDQVLAFTKSSGGEFFNNFGNTVKANPVPTILTSIGVMWLMLGQNRRPPAPGESLFDHLGERVSSTAEHLSDSLGNAKDRMTGKTNGITEKASHLADSAAGFTHNVGDKMSAVGDQLQASAHTAADTVRRQGQQLQASFDYMIREQPLALAAMGIALGAAIGAALPSTDRENKIMGAASDQITQKAKTMATTTYDKVTEMGKEFVDDITTTTKESGNRAAEPASQPSSSAGL